MARPMPKLGIGVAQEHEAGVARALISGLGLMRPVPSLTLALGGTHMVMGSQVRVF